MRIAVIASPELKLELESKPFPPKDEWVWADSPDALLMHQDADAFYDLEFSPEQDRIDSLSRLLPAPVIVGSVVSTLKEIGRPFVRISAWPGLVARGVHELAVPDAETGQRIRALYARLGWQMRIVPDTPGMISPRIIAMIINEAWYTWQEKVSTKEEIDTAMRLGTNYPFGPFEWGERIGLRRISDLLWSLSRDDKRYVPCEALLTGTGVPGASEIKK